MKHQVNSDSRVFDQHRHLRTVLAEFTQHYNGHRPHQNLQQEPPLQPGRAVDLTARIERRQVLSGLISEYRRAG